MPIITKGNKYNGFMKNGSINITRAVPENTYTIEPTNP